MTPGLLPQPGGFEGPSSIHAKTTLRLNRLLRLQARAHCVLHTRRVQVLLKARDLAVAQREHVTELSVDARAGGLVTPAR